MDIDHPTASWDVAVSYASEDSAYVHDVTHLLLQAGVRVFDYADRQAELWGKDLFSELGSVYGDAPYTLVFVSRSYREKAWVKPELRHALGRAMKRGEASVLPVALDDTELPEIPPSTVFVDGRSNSPSRIVELVLQRVGHPGQAARSAPDSDPTDDTPVGSLADFILRSLGDIEALTNADPLVFFPAVARLQPGRDVFEAALLAPFASRAHLRALRALLARDPEPAGAFLLEIIRSCPASGAGWGRALRASRLFSQPLHAASSGLWELACGWEPERKRHALVALGHLGEILSPSELRAHVLRSDDQVGKALSFAVSGSAASYQLASGRSSVDLTGECLRELLDWERTDPSCGFPKTSPDLRAADSSHYDDLIDNWLGASAGNAAAAMAGLAERGVVRAVPAIAECLAVTDMRRPAAQALGRIGGCDAAALLDALPEPDPARAELVHVIHDLPDDRFQSVVTEFAGSGTTWLVGWLVRSIGLRRAEEHGGLVRQALGASSPIARGCAAIAAARLGLVVDFERFVAEAAPGDEQTMGLAAMVCADPLRYDGAEARLRAGLLESITGMLPARIVEDIFHTIGVVPAARDLIAAWRPVADSWGARI